MENTTMNVQRWSCFHCLKHFELPADTKEPKCPICGEVQHIKKRCIADPAGGCHCPDSVNPGVKYCEVCGKPVCPICGCHDVAQVSRVTGYLSDVAGWNAAKQQELKDRQRVPIEGGMVRV